MKTSYVEAQKLQPTDFEVQYFDQYEYYNLTDRYALPAAARKGRTKKEAEANTNRESPGGHERKIAGKLQRSEGKKKGKAGKDKPPDGTKTHGPMATRPTKRTRTGS
ncbi:hypothetical protein XENTR_v10023021 [Xenopus tropicalis]|nr:hypothetical protein XENTR_v10023021 [Xenopus tropicalis]